MISKFIRIFRKRRFWAAILFAQFLLFYTGSKSKTFVDFFITIFEKKKNFHQSLFSEIYFSVGDVFYLILLIVLILAGYLYFKSKHKKKLTLFFIIVLNIGYFSYQCTWGMLYFQTPIMKKLPKHEVTVEDIKFLSEELLDECLQLRNNIREDKNGVFEITQWYEIKKNIITSQKLLPTKFSNKKTNEIVNIKNTLFGRMMDKTGILGYYNPFSGEAHYNENLPHTYIPFTMAHESAHQLGFAREQEANFIGYLICEKSEDNQVQYSAKWYALKSLLQSVSEKDPEFVLKIKNKFSHEMLLDYTKEQEFWEENKGILTRFFSITNDLFLKSNQQEGSITYSYFNELLILYKKQDIKK